MRQAIYFYAPAALAVIAIFVGSAIPSTELPPIVFAVWDKALHATEYAVFSILVARALATQRYWDLVRRHWFVACIVLVSLYGATDEIHQSFVPGRVEDVFDWTADSIGGLIGALLCLIPIVREFPRLRRTE